MPSSHVITGVVEGLLQVGTALGLERARLLERAGLDESRLLDRDARLPLDHQIALGEAIVALRPGVNLGLVMLQRMQPGMFGVLGQALAHSRTLAHALETFMRYQAFVTDALRWIRLGASRLAVEVDDRLVSIGHPVEASVGMWVTLGRALTGTHWAPQALSFRHAPLGDPQEHASLFGVVPRFEAERNVLVLAPETLELPVVGAIAGLREPLARLLDHHVTAAAEPEIVTQLRTELRRRLPQGVSKTEVARALGMSERTLGRRLQGAGTSYAAVLDDTRRDSALDLLGDPRLAVYEAAFLLGYREPSTFHRAFRRWTGESPDAWRRARTQPSRSDAR